MNQSIDLEAAKAAFFASGGQLVVLEGFTYQPLPQRKHPEPCRKKRKGPPPIQNGTRQEVAMARADMVAKMAESMTCREASLELKVSQSSLWDMAKRYGFKFVQGNRGKHTETPEAEDRDAKLAERIQALRDAGLSRYAAALKLEIGHAKLKRLTEKFDIDFPRKIVRSYP
ncbi:hypothetical protein [Pseudomonas sp. LP_4_YM]|uniref:hypothetical protein n=1 Tax=Pseudomonas sp. LP_4_YM TaxID=2485135 RepID=UPI00104FF353|nr:hypothetical protein [Pseudomonas sp. LP_4_YM]TCT82904.1 hypothetical protein EC913_1609 [Pseudomonas sp. LP_4_YM]